MFELGNIKRVGDEFSRVEAGMLTIATTHTQARYKLPTAIQQFMQTYPQVKLNLHQGNPMQVTDWVATGEADIGIATESIAQEERLICLPCYEWNRSVVVPKGHDLERVPLLSLANIASYPLITYDFAFTGSTTVSKVFHDAGVTPNVVLTAIDADVIKTYVNLTDVWQRFDLTFTNPSGSTFGYGLSRKGTTSDETLTRCYVWGAQLEVGSYPTSYIPNFGTALGVTRNQDIFTRDGIGSLINSTEGVLFVEMAALSDDLTYRRISLSDSTEDNRISISYDDVSNTISGQVFVGGVEQSLLTYVLSDITEFSKIALKYKVNDFELWVDGYEIATGVSGSVFPQGTLNSLSFDNGSSVQNFFGKVKQLQVYDTTLTVSQLENLTV